MSPPKSLCLSPQYNEEQWRAAFDNGEDWKTAINTVEDRIKGRWLDAAQLLLPRPGFGFAILALDCVVIESMWGFMNGKPTPSGREKAKAVYRSILTRPTFGFKETESDNFLELIRNGIMHDAETRNQWLVEKTIPRNAIISKNKGGYVLNRTKFHEALSAAFECWIADLRGGNVALRENMRKRMDQTIDRQYKK
jgi:hypothetical protein